MTKRAGFDRAMWASVSLATAALIAPANLGSPASAQTPATPGAVSLNPFEGDNPTPTPQGVQAFKDAVARGNAPGECPKAKVTVRVKKGDPVFQAALAGARRDALLQSLGDRVRRHVLFETDSNAARDEVRVEYDAWRDREQPRLVVAWTPENGAKVPPGQRIEAKAAARDDVNLWQSGIKTIDLVADGNRPFGFQDYPQPPLTCERTPPLQRLDGAYTVPPSAAPGTVIRLRAIVEDFAGNKTEREAAFTVEKPDEPRDGGGRQDAGGRDRNRCDEKKIVRGLDFSFICP
ncbi:MAG TPA: hypothetical protein VFK79_01415 [Xanthobacteraceae bacterium]|nr:hypothetical protein [Xanthobacteraceae bacterium]